MFIEQKAKHRDTIVLQQTNDKGTENVCVCEYMYIYTERERMGKFIFAQNV